MVRACRKEWPCLFLLCAATATRTSDVSFPPNCFSSLHRSQKLFRTDNSSRASFTPTPCDCSSRLVEFPPGCHVPSGDIWKEEAALGSEPAFQQCGRTGLRSLSGRGTLGFAPLSKRGNQKQKQLVFHSAV